MKKRRNKLLAFVLSAMLLISGTAMGATPVQAVEKTPPELQGYDTGSGGYDFALAFDSGTSADWLGSITGITVNGSAWKKGSSSFSVWNNDSYYANASSGKLYIGEGFTGNTATCVISATGYRDLTLTLNKSGHTAKVTEEESQSYAVTVAAADHGRISVNKSSARAGDTVTITATPDAGYELSTLAATDAEGKALSVKDSSFEMPASDVMVRATFAEKQAASEKEISLHNISVTLDSFSGLWQFTFGDSAYPDAITQISVNDTVWESYSFAPSTGGKYRIRDGAVEFAEASYGQIAALKSGDVITITADGYKTLTFKVSISGRTLTVSEDTTPGDDMQLHVRLVGSFEAALVNQKGYDAISGASTNVTQNKNSNASVEVAIVKKDTTPTDSDWKLLSESDLRVNSKKSSVLIVNRADTSKGNDSGMAGVYSVHDGSVTLAGTPAKAGTYDISVTITDQLGRTASSNTLPFRIYSGEETLQDQLILDNCTQTQDGKYMYDMEPWAIKNFTLASGNQTVIVPADVKAWYGSHESGTYGELGYAVSEGVLPTQTLILPKGCNLTLVNMDILSSVKIIVQDGAKLTLRDSVIQGAVEVERGGTFSMNYNDYGDGEFLNGASINGKVVLQDGATLENAKIYSNTNNIANGSQARHNTDPVLVINGNVTLKGKVFLRGDEAPTGTDPATGKSYTGQTGMQVNGTLTLAEDAVLAVFGGGKDATTSNGGTAIDLNGGTITGSGKLIAVGGDGHFGDGGNAISGNGTISVKDAYLEGGASVSKNGTPGKALASGVKLSGSTNRNLIDGSTVNGIDYDNDTYWRDTLGQPDLSLYPVEANAPGTDPVVPGGDSEKPEVKPGESEKPELKPTGTKSAASENPGAKSTGSENQESAAAAQTGDSSLPLLWTALLLAAIATAGTLVICRRNPESGKR